MPSSLLSISNVPDTIFKSSELFMPLRYFALTVSVPSPFIVRSAFEDNAAEYSSSAVVFLESVIILFVPLASVIITCFASCIITGAAVELVI